MGINRIVVYAILTSIAIVLLVIKKKRKSYVLATSTKIRDLVVLNKSTKQIQFIRKSLKFNKGYKSKKSLDNSKIFNAAVQYANENKERLKEMIAQYTSAQKEYEAYRIRAIKIMEQSMDYDKLASNTKLFFKGKSYKKVEEKIINELLFKNENLLTLNVKCYYVSPKGQNYYCKEKTFQYEDLVELIGVIKNRQDYMKSAEYQRSIMNDSIRFDVLKRDNFCCKICGASAAEDGVKLEVDHIVPVSKGGKTEMENLQTLCIRCNRGKRDKY